jgi:hypothetical protein
VGYDVPLSEVILAVLLVGSNVFWAFCTHRLINKLMSRSYFEFKQAELKSDEKPSTIKLPADDIEDFGALAELGR